MAERCVLYVDGFNFYYAIKRNSEHAVERKSESTLHLGWCDFHELATREFVPAGATLVRIRYFTAPVESLGKSGGELGGEQNRQNVWLNAVSTVRDLQVIEGFHSEDRELDPMAPQKHRTEKQTDVNIAVRMVADAARNRCDRLLLVTGDQDQIPAVLAVRDEFGKVVDVWLPPNQGGTPQRWKWLSARGGVTVRQITLDMLRRYRLPERIDQGGRVIEAPKMWRAPAPRRTSG